jgi:hypothetical protein
MIRPLEAVLEKSLKQKGISNFANPFRIFKPLSCGDWFKWLGEQVLGKTGWLGEADSSKTSNVLLHGNDWNP